MKFTLNASTYLLIAILIFTTLVVAGVSNFLLYKTAIEQESIRLQELVNTQASLMEAVAEFDQLYSVYAYQGNAEEATLSQIKKALNKSQGIGATGELTLAKREKGHFVFLLRHRHQLPDQKQGMLRIEWGSALAAPMQLALAGNSGTVVAKDYRGVDVLAAYEPVEQLNYGIVAKIDLAEIRAPFVSSFNISMLIAGVVISISATCFYWIISPLVRRITKSESDLRLILNSADEGIFGMNKQGECIFANDATLKLLGYNETSELVGREMHGLIHHHYEDGSVYPDHKCPLLSGLEREQPTVIEDEVYWRNDGTSFFTHSRIFPMYERGKCTGAVVIFVDITDKKGLEEQGRIAQSVYDNVHEGLLVTDADAKIISVNKAFSAITGYSEEEVIGKNPRLLQSGKQDVRFYQEMWRSLHVKGVWKGEILNRNKSGVIYPQWQTISVLKSADGKVINYVAAFSDITSLKVTHERMEYLAHHDPLTDLPNRLLFNARFDLSLQNARRKQRRLALLLLDLDGFKLVNDSLGHPVGDELLQHVAKRLNILVRQEDTIARFGGDEFAIVFYDVGNTSNIEKLAGSIVESLGKPYAISDETVNISCSVGISIYPDHFEDKESLMGAADSSMYLAKEGGKNGYRLYEKS